MSVKLWKFRHAGRVSIMDIDGQRFIGKVVAMFDAEETVDGENRIDIELADGNIIDFAESEIRSIKELE